MSSKRHACLLAMCLVLAMTNTPRVSADTTSLNKSKVLLPPFPYPHGNPNRAQDVAKKPTLKDIHSEGSGSDSEFIPDSQMNWVFGIMGPDPESALKEYNEIDWDNFSDATGLLEDGKVVRDTVLVFGSIVLGALVSVVGSLACPFLLVASPFMSLRSKPVFTQKDMYGLSPMEKIGIRLKNILHTFLMGIAAPFAGVGVVAFAGSKILPGTMEHFVTSMKKKMHLASSMSKSVFGKMNKLFNKLKAHTRVNHAAIEGGNSREKRGLDVSMQREELAQLQNYIKEANAQADDMLKESETMLTKLESTKVSPKDHKNLHKSIESARGLVSFLIQYKKVWTEAAEKAHQVPTTCSKNPPRFSDLTRSLAKKFDETSVESA